MMTKKSSIKFGGSAVAIAVLIIGVALIANPSLLPAPVAAQSTFAIMLTDPPTVPAGTTQLSMTYADLSIHVISQDGTSSWLPVKASGTLNLFSLVNVSQTIASTTVPINSTVDKVQFTISKVSAEVNNQVYDVTVLSNIFVVNVENARVNETQSGVLVDFNPTLVQIQADDVNGANVNYYVLVPSANAVIINGLSQDHAKVGTIVQIGENNRVRLAKVRQDFNRDVAITSASLGIDGNTTSLSVTLKNNGDAPFKIFGLTLNGEFKVYHNRPLDQGLRGRVENYIENRIHPDTIPFKISDTSLTPLFGGRDDSQGNTGSAIVLQPGETATVSFSGVIALHTDNIHFPNPVMTIDPNAGSDYTIRLMGEGYQTYTVTAQSQS